MVNNIPKIIHYCWFGGKEIPVKLQEYMKTWEILAGYTIMRWDETNCSFDENEFVKIAYAQQRWGFIGDYYRYKSLYEYGGIYLDTDVKVKKTFDDLLNNHAFIGFMYDVAICTAIIGSEKHGTFVKSMLDMYDTGKYATCESVMHGKEESDQYSRNNWTPSNEFATWNLIKFHKEFKLNNRKQRLSDVTVYPNYFFDIGDFWGREYSRHMYTNSWGKNGISFGSQMKVKLQETLLGKKMQVIKRVLTYKSGQKNTTFYQYRKQIGQQGEK